MECHFITYLVSRNCHFPRTLALLWNIPCLFLNILCLKQSSQASRSYLLICYRRRRLTCKDCHVLSPVLDITLHDAFLKY